MKIALVHNFYQLHGGEDSVFNNEKKLLSDHGHEVSEFTKHNDEIKTYGAVNKLKLGINTVYNRRARDEFNEFLEKTDPDIVHAHNTFPLISQSIYDSCRAKGIPVVQRLPNYRLLCPNALFFTDDQVCQRCASKTFAWPGVVGACYRGSKLQTANVAVMLYINKLLRSSEKVDMFIALTEFAKAKFIQFGVPENKISLKPNFHSASKEEFEYKITDRSGALYLGRLSSEKGVETIIEAWKSLPAEIPLKIVGSGPLKERLLSKVSEYELKNVTFIDHIEREQVHGELAKARFLIFSSEWYETFGLTMIEAYACGTPVIGSRISGIPEIVKDGKTGLLYDTGDAEDLAKKVKWAWHNQEELVQMGKNARLEYEEKYSPEVNYKILMQIYESALDKRSA